VGRPGPARLVPGPKQAGPGRDGPPVWLSIGGGGAPTLGNEGGWLSQVSGEGKDGTMAVVRDGLRGEQRRGKVEDERLACIPYILGITTHHPKN
jgi:hypothetical protein